MQTNQILIKAKKDFKRIIKNSEKKDLIACKKGGYGIFSAKFAMQYTNPDKEPEIYNKIYYLFYNYFEKLKI